MHLEKRARVAAAVGTGEALAFLGDTMMSRIRSTYAG